MTKNSRGIVLVALSALVFTLVLFVLPVAKDSVFWVSYIFGVIAILVLAVTSQIALRRVKTVKDRFMQTPIVMIAYQYLVGQMFVSFTAVILVLFNVQVKSYIVIIISLIMLATAIVRIMYVDAARGEIERIDRKVKEKTQYLQRLKLDLELMANSATPEIQDKLNDLIDTVTYSDPMSDPSLAILESKIETTVLELGEAVRLKDNTTIETTIETCKQQLLERNKRAKMLK